MRKFTIVLIIVLISSLLSAETMIIHFNNGETTQFDTSDITEITFDNVSIEEVVNFISQIPIKFLKNYPNPFNPTTKIAFEIGESGTTKVEVFNIKGQKVKTLINERMNAGEHSVIWNGKNNNNKQVVSGVYFYRVSVNGSQRTNKMIMLK